MGQKPATTMARGGPSSAGPGLGCRQQSPHGAGWGCGSRHPCVHGQQRWPAGRTGRVRALQQAPLTRRWGQAHSSHEHTERAEGPLQHTHTHRAAAHSPHARTEPTHPPKRSRLQHLRAHTAPRGGGRGRREQTTHSTTAMQLVVQRTQACGRSTQLQREKGRKGGEKSNYFLQVWAQA